MPETPVCIYCGDLIDPDSEGYHIRNKHDPTRKWLEYAHDECALLDDLRLLLGQEKDVRSKGLESEEAQTWVTRAEALLEKLNPNDAHDFTRYADRSHPASVEASESEIFTAMFGILKRWVARRHTTAWGVQPKRAGIESKHAGTPQVGSSRTLRVFLCHSSSDKPAARALYQRLRADGFVPWLDEEDLLPGQDWNLEIRKAVRAAAAVIVCLSPASTTKEGYVQKEIAYALDVADEKPEGTIFVIPGRLEPCDVPDRLRRWQWVDLYEAGGYEKLLLSLRDRENAIQAAAPSSHLTKPRALSTEVVSGPVR